MRQQLWCCGVIEAGSPGKAAKLGWSGESRGLAGFWDVERGYQIYEVKCIHPCWLRLKCVWNLPLLLLLRGNLAVHLTSLLGSLWLPCPSPPGMLRVEVLLSLAALVFLFSSVREFCSLD